MEFNLNKADIVEDFIRKAKQIVAIGRAISHCGENNDRNQILEIHGESFGEIVEDIAKGMQGDLKKLEGLILNTDQEIKGPSPLPERDEGPGTGSLRSDRVLKVAHG